MKRTAPVLPLAVLLVLAACSAGRTGASPGTSPGDETAGSGAIEHPTSAEEPIFTIEYAGGFVPVQFLATQTPTFVLLGDGRVVVQGMQTMEFPGPALPPLMERRLNEEGIQEVLRAISATNLFDEDLDLRAAQNMVADASDTIFTVNAGGRKVTVSVYGLGTLTPGVQMPPGMSEAEMQAHAVLQQLNDRMVTLETWLPASAWEDDAWRPYEPEALRLYVRDVTAEPRDGVAGGISEWPADASGDPAAFGEEQRTFGDGTRCGVVDGEKAAAWFQALSAATQATLWSDDGERVFSVMPRPLLPHEEPACPELVGA